MISPRGWETFSETDHAQLVVQLEEASWERLTVGTENQENSVSFLFKPVATVKEKEVTVVVS